MFNFLLKYCLNVPLFFTQIPDLFIAKVSHVGDVKVEGLKVVGKLDLSGIDKKRFKFGEKQRLQNDAKFAYNQHIAYIKKFEKLKKNDTTRKS